MKIFRERKSILALILLSLCFLVLSCNKGFEDYYSEKTTKGGFLFDKVKSQAEFSIFAKALERANLVQFISEGGLYTVFAPTNEAFSKFLSNNGYTSIESVPVDRLFKILSYHIVNNMWYYYEFKVRFATFQQKLYLTRNRKFVEIDVKASEDFKVNNVAIIKSLRDINAENGVIHGINEVLIPLSSLEETFLAEPELANSTFYKLMQVVKDSAFDRFNSFDRDRDGRMDSAILQNLSFIKWCFYIY